jgi:hypothetical protein
MLYRSPVLAVALTVGEGTTENTTLPGLADMPYFATFWVFDVSASSTGDVNGSKSPFASLGEKTTSSGLEQNDRSVRPDVNMVQICSQMHRHGRVRAFVLTCLAHLSPHMLSTSSQIKDIFSSLPSLINAWKGFGGQKRISTPEEGEDVCEYMINFCVRAQRKPI